MSEGGDMKEEQLCKCGIDYQTWQDYEVLCVEDGLHIWEE